MARAKGRRTTELRFFIGLLGLFILLIVMWLAVLAVVPAAVMGWHTVAVTSGSMDPSIVRGDVVVAAPDDERSTLRPGTVVVFREASGHGLITHRIVGRNADGSYATAGDANRVADSTPLHRDQVVGEGRILVPLAGLPVAWSRSGEWLKLAAAGLVLGLALWSARFALFDDHDPWRERRPRSPRRADRHRPPRWRRAPVLPVLLVAIASAVLAVEPAARARFGAITANGTSSWASAASFGGMRINTGVYDGDATDNRPITGVGFRPDVVFVKCTCGLSAVTRTTTMTGDASKELGSVGALQPDHVQTLDSDGFTVGASTRVNGPSRTYYWVAMRGGSDLQVGSYVGNGVDDRSITGLGFQPAWVITLGDGDDSTMRPSTLAGDASYPMDGISQFANRIQALQADGFQVGSNAAVNEVGTTFHYVAWKAGANVKQGTYLGTGSDNISITGVGFQPRLVWVKRDTANQATWRPDAVVGDLSLFWSGTVASADRIQALEPDGFQVGTNAQVNNLLDTYHYVAFKDG